MRFAVPVLLATCLPLVGAPVPTETKDKSVLYFAAKVGDKLVYDVAHNDGKATELAMVVTEVKEKGGVFTVTLKRSGGKDASAQTAMVSAGGLTLAQDSDTPITLFKLPAKTGDSWVSAPSEKGVAVTIKSTFAGEQEVEVPAGKFKAIRADVTISVGGRDRVVSMWHARGVGLVKMASESGGKETVQVLKSFTPGK